jgi:hypothetical protein
MTTTLYEDGGLTITQFAGSRERGVCVQIDADSGLDAVQLTRAQAETVVTALAKWLGLKVERGTWTRTDQDDNG